MSYDFPGTVGAVNLINSKVGVSTGKLITVAVWFNANVADGGGSQAGGGAKIWAHGNRNTEQAYLGFNGGNKLAYGRRWTGTGTGVASVWETSAALAPITGWKAVVITHNATNNATNPIMYVFRQGSGPMLTLTVGAGLTRVGTGTGSNHGDGQTFRLGNNSPTGDCPFNGKIYSLTVWRRILSSEEVRKVIFRGDKEDSVKANLVFGWDLKNEPPVPPGPEIDDWTPANILGVPVAVPYSKVNPLRIFRSGPVVVV